MDVRCEKCQTEYELDEARLKPGGVTVKCTNCGHMFKIRKRTITNVGVPSPSGPKLPRPDSVIGDMRTVDTGPAQPERQWLIRLENGEQKSCRELAALQQWIVAGIVTRESLISRTGKTWKRLGDINELAQYFALHDEARGRTPRPAVEPQATMLGVGSARRDSDDDSLERASTDKIVGRTAKDSAARRPGTVPPPIPGRTPAKGVSPTGTTPAIGVPPSGAKTPPLGSAMSGAGTPSTPPPKKRPTTQPPPPPGRRAPTLPPAVPEGARGTAVWAKDGIVPKTDTAAEPAFAGRPISSRSPHPTERVESLDDDDVLPRHRGSRAGMLIVISALVVMAAAGIVIYVVAIRTDTRAPAQAPGRDAAIVAVPSGDAGSPVVTPVIDAPLTTAVPPLSPLDVARDELPGDLEPRVREARGLLAGKNTPPEQAVRAHLGVAIAQSLLDRAALSGDRAESERLRKEAAAVVLEAAGDAQRAFKAIPQDAVANLAMAGVLRLQRKSPREITRYLDVASKNASSEWARDVALSKALVLARDGKLEPAKAAFAAIDQGDSKLESSGDVRARLNMAILAHALGQATEAKVLVDQILAAQPDHLAAKALATKLETSVVKTDPLPPEEGTKQPPAPTPTPTPAAPIDRPAAGGGDSYDRLLAKANTMAESNCTKAMDLYERALEQKPNGVEALTGMGYCHIDAKQFATAFSKFRAALAVSPRFEPALWGVAETYVQQGRKEQAIEAVKAYLEAYPDSPKAKKLLDRLDPGGQSSGPATTPGPAPEGSLPDTDSN
ncbi:MAG: tetratricopeptide repeat protein [Kofleriaceae bacterium]